MMSAGYHYLPHTGIHTGMPPITVPARLEVSTARQVIAWTSIAWACSVVLRVIAGA